MACSVGYFLRFVLFIVHCYVIIMCWNRIDLIRGWPRWLLQQDLFKRYCFNHVQPPISQNSRGVGRSFGPGRRPGPNCFLRRAWYKLKFQKRVEFMLCFHLNVAGIRKKDSICSCGIIWLVCYRLWLVKRIQHVTCVCFLIAEVLYICMSMQGCSP